MSEEIKLSVEKAAQRLGLSRTQVYRRIQNGQLPATVERTGKMRYTLAADDIEKYIAAGSGSRMVGAQTSPGAMMKASDVSAVLGVSIETVRKLCDNGDLQHRRGSGDRGHYYIPRWAVDKYLASHFQ